MLKKAGIITAVAAAGAIALTPFAFAHDSHHESPAPVQYTNVEDGNLSNDCQFAQTGPDIDSNVSGGDALVGAGGLVANAVAPISAPIQALNCTNIGVSDVVDVNSNNETRTAESTEVEDSFNTEG
ncbi:hypothetical protein [Pseudonocardia humida]|uniref:Small secreted domain DUF320 n=1 Tax=Pseudonocardia humida TaxID=2800819 RepID=A0ABT1ADQ3_9PSEU|nr:hypothetical protein [Pseudonocardia humida]MCO1661194.1 hypothetical protein [Pseudonocardia humida]